MGRWFSGSAGSFWAIIIMPRMLFRPSSWCWHARPGRFATPTCSAHGCMALPSARLAPARKQNAGRRKTEEERAVRLRDSLTAPAADLAMIDREQAEALHREIERLPGPFRVPIVLCYFEGLSLDEAAHRLRWPAGTLRSRLARAREKLRRGLDRGGFTFSINVLAALEPRSTAANFSTLLTDATTRAAVPFAAERAAAGSVPAPVMALAREVLRSMQIHQWKSLSMAVLVFVAVAAGVGYWRDLFGRQDEPVKTPAGQTPPAAAKLDGTNAKPGRMFVVGRVLDPDGKPVPNATAMVYAAQKQPGSGGGGSVERMKPSTIGQARSDNSGRFQIDAPRTSSSRHHRMGIVAIASGYGAGWAEADPDAIRPGADISLWPEQVIHGRLFDLIGRPVQGAEVRVQRMGRVIPGNLGRQYPYGIDGPSFWWNPGNGLPAWPKPAISDSEGRFAVHDVGRDLRVVLMIDDPRFARQTVPIDADGTSALKPATLALVPAKIIKGRITDADTGKPIPHAQLRVLSYSSSLSSTVSEFEADAEGWFRANPLPAKADRYEVSATAPDGQPYLGVSKLFDWPKGAVEYPIDLALPRGMVIHGKVMEEGTGKPVAGARISFATLQSIERQSGAMNGRTASQLDGSFQLGVLPNPGHLVVLGPSDDFVLREIDGGQVLYGKPGGRRFYAHALVACEPKPDGASLDVKIMLRPAIPVSGRVVGPDGQAIENAWMISRVCFAPSAMAWRSWRANHHDTVKSGRFELHGLDPGTEQPVYFLEPHQKLGAAASFSAKPMPDGSATVRLQPCGTARARLVDTSGKPIAGYRGSRLVSMGVTSPYLFRHQEWTLAVIDKINYGDGLVSDALGRIAFPALIPGAPYRISNFKTGTQRSKDFTVKPGETVDLGDFVIDEPRTQ